MWTSRRLYTYPHTAELFATVRDNGRILDDFRRIFGGHAIFEAKFELGKIMEDPSISKWTFHLQKWPRDVNLRAGMRLWLIFGPLRAQRYLDPLSHTHTRKLHPRSPHPLHNESDNDYVEVFSLMTRIFLAWQVFFLK